MRPPANIIILALADILAWLGALCLAFLVYPHRNDCQLGQYLLALWPAPLLLLFVSATLGLYNTPWLKTKPELNAVNEIRAQYLAAVTTTLVTLATLALTHSTACFPRGILVISTVFLPTALIAARHVARKLAHLPKRHLVVNGAIQLEDGEIPRHGLAFPMPHIFKTCAELLLAVALLITAAPLAILLALLVKLSGKGSVLYVATRLGKHGRPFRLLKFRTMKPDADQLLPQLLHDNPRARSQWRDNVKLDHDPRITPCGRLLRQTSLDELPQLLNVLVGDMAIIGPRPITHEEQTRYAEDFATFASVKPGLTGLWQVSGRNDLTYQQRVKLDIWYIEHWSLWLDLYILHKTIPEILSLHGR